MVLSGCTALMIGGLAYTGYQYHEKEGVFAPGQPLGGPAPDSNNNATKSSDNTQRQSPPASEIE